MSPQGESRRIGTAGGLAGLLVVVVIAEVSFPLLGSEPAGWIARAPAAQVDPLHREIVRGQSVALDDSPGFAPDGMAARSHVSHAASDLCRD